MKNRWWLLGLLLVGCRVETHASVEEAKRSNDSEERIALSDVPAHVRQAALAAVPGLVLTDAEKEIENGVTIFSLSGTAGGKPYEVEVTASGTVGEIEADDGPDDDDDGPDGDDDDGEDKDD